mmetsp:Transcript_27679/g.64921  ORF Transcript_27679/g.64921 Transcript_27679/m.64921 type:complete len:245 (-) Transcript_27679:1616-2350(-)
MDTESSLRGTPELLLTLASSSSTSSSSVGATAVPPIVTETLTFEHSSSSLPSPLAVAVDWWCKSANIAHSPSDREDEEKLVTDVERLETATAVEGATLPVPPPLIGRSSSLRRIIFASPMRLERGSHWFVARLMVFIIFLSPAHLAKSLASASISRRLCTDAVVPRARRTAASDNKAQADRSAKVASDLFSSAEIVLVLVLVLLREESERTDRFRPPPTKSWSRRAIMYEASMASFPTISLQCR